MSKDREESVNDKSRREFLKGIGVAALGVLVADNLSAKQPSKEVTIQAPQPTIPESDDPLTIMQKDVLRALEKPPAERRWGMVIDLRKCTGCSACTVACIAENNLPPGVVYRPVMTEDKGKYPNVSRRFLPRPCMHCENPPCTPVCPVRATYKREDGVVVMDYEKCIGCRYCLTACPYGARTFDFGEFYSDGLPGHAPYEERKAFEYHKKWKRRRGIVLTETPPVGNVRKCHFCIHRIERGLLPACVTTCIGKATYFGDLNDEESLVATLAHVPQATTLKEDLGTEPKVFYIL